MEARRAKSWPILALYLLFMAATVAAFQGIRWQLDVASEHGKGVDAMIHFLMLATGAMFVAGHLITGWFILRSSRSDAPAWSPPRASSEWMATLVPVIIVAVAAEGGVLAIGMPVWAQVYHDDPDALRVEVVGKQFEWIAHYPGADGKLGKYDPKQVDDQENPIGLDAEDPAAKDDIVSRGSFALPVGRMASLRLRSIDVLHSFSVPLFRTKQDLVPGMPTRTQVRPVKPGRYEISCAELCGLGHYRMRAWVNVMSEADFNAWLAKQPTFGE